MRIELHSVVPCADVATYSCTANVHQVAPGDFAALLKRAGFTVATLPNRGTVIGRRAETMVLLEPAGGLTITRLRSREGAEELIQELIRHHEESCP